MSKLKLAIQKSGRLSEQSLTLISNCGISLNNGAKLKAIANNFPLEVLYLRDDDIPKYVEQGIADIGIVGGNVLAETNSSVSNLQDLNFGKCRLSLAIQREKAYNGISTLKGKTIATSYPNILKAYLRREGIQAKVEYISGSVEIAPSIGLADAIFDIVSTGSTLLKNGLKEVQTLMYSQAQLIANSNLDTKQTAVLNQFLTRLTAYMNASSFKYVLLNAPNDKLDEICAIIPGMKSPSVLPLRKTGWSSLHSVCKEEEFWGIADQLSKLGAEGILVCPIEKMIQ